MSGWSRVNGLHLRIRTRLALAIAAVLVVTLLLSSLVVIRGARNTLVDQADEELIEFVDHAQGPGRTPGGPTMSREGGERNGFYEWPFALLVFSPAGELLDVDTSGFNDDPDPLPDVPLVPSEEVDDLVGQIVTVPAVEGTLHYRLLVQREPDGDIFMAATPLAEVDAAIDRLVRLLLIVGAIALAVATLVSWWLIRRGLRPVDRMVDTAAAIAAGDLSRRVPEANPGTELGRLGRALNDMLHQIEKALHARAASEERLRRFVADAAHELRTPLTSLRGYAELYRQGALPDQDSVAIAMGHIESEGARMARLVEDLLLLARLDQQRGLEFEPVNISAVVEDAVAAFRAVQPDRPVTQALDDRMIVSGDRLRLRQVIDNLLANARGHTPADTPVHVAVSRDGGQVAISVADEGPGIAPADQARIFGRFWRGQGRLRSGAGTGLGLAIVASLVEAHGGAIEVASQPDHGATFTVRLPLLGHGDPVGEGVSAAT